MNAGLSHSLESSIGPPSEPIDIPEFLRSDLTFLQPRELDPSVATVAEECSVSAVKQMLQDTWDDVKLSGHLLKDHDILIGNALAAGEAKKKRRRIVNFEEPSSQPPDLKKLQDFLKLIGRHLKSWPYPPESAIFMRAPKNTDTNALVQVKSSAANQNPTTQSPREAVITVTIYNPVPWGHNYLARASTHLLRSSQTLAHLYDLLICASTELPEEKIEGGEMQGYSTDYSQVSRSCVICIEGLAYADGCTLPDYADKLLEQVALLPEDKRPKIAKARTSLASTQFGSLTLRINEPYHILHQGNCEHFFVVDSIRLQTKSEDLSHYPITTQITPFLVDLCRGCCKVPAVWSIVGDTRLQESPCVMCQPCWKNMGPSEDDNVFVVALPRHVVGW